MNQVENMDLQAETLQNGTPSTDTNANVTDNLDYYKIEQIPETPFTKIFDGENWKIALGQQVVTPDFPTENQVMEYYAAKSWVLIMSVFHAMANIREERQKLNIKN